MSADEKMNDTKGETSEDIEPKVKKESKIKSAINFLMGDESEEVSQEAEGLPGIFSFFKNNWEKKEEQESAGFFNKIKNLYSDYQVSKETEVEKLNTYETIERAARFSKEFFVLLSGSCLIATIGLLQGSTAVIIGAMIVAPLMMPILGFALGTIWGDRLLIWRSLLTLLIGSVFALLISTSLSFLLPGVEFNDEIKGRINPNLYDIFIALASGFVGAYAYVNPKISSTVSGVAIAVALMPPICVVGIALGQFDLRAAFGSMMLYLTNLVSISLAASLVFWRMKIHPTTASKDEVSERVKRKVLLTIFVLLLIALPLGYFMRETYVAKKQYSNLREILIKNIPNIDILNLEIKKFPERFKIKAIIIVSPDTPPSVLDKTKKIAQNIFKRRVDFDF